MNIITDIEQLSNRCDEVLDLRKESKEVQRIILALKETIMRANNYQASSPLRSKSNPSTVSAAL